MTASGKPSSGAPSAEPLRVERLVVGGGALARLPDGRVALIDGALPGDCIQPLGVVNHGGYVRVERHQLIEAGAQRVDPACPVAQRCGGCDLMSLADPAQGAAKIEMLREALRRTGGMRELPEPIELVRGARRFEYRNRIRLQCDADKVGFFSHASHEVVEVPNCLVARPALRDALSRLRELIAGNPAAVGRFAHVELRISELEAGGGSEKWREHADPRPSLCWTLKPDAKRPPKTWQGLREALAADFSVWVNSRSRRDKVPPLQPFDLPFGVTLLAPVGGFVQVNWEVNRLLVNDLVEGVLQRRVTDFVDVYCGAGNFSLPLLRQGLVGAGVESNRAAVAALQTAAELQDLDAQAFVTGEAVARAREWRSSGRRWQLAILDPPRAGVKRGLDDVAELSSRYLAMCSCDPATLARDLGRLAKSGWVLEKLTAYDMFPQTHHLETLAWLRRSS